VSAGRSPSSASSASSFSSLRCISPSSEARCNAELAAGSLASLPSRLRRPQCYADPSPVAAFDLPSQPKARRRHCGRGRARVAAYRCE
jgi:hypothetical protein